MKLLKNKFLISLLLALLLPLTLVFPTMVANGKVSSYGRMTKMTNELFFEEFNNDIYIDLSETNAWGVGTGTVTSTRNLSWSFLDYYETEDPVYDLEVQGKKAYLAVYNKTFVTESITVLNLENPSDIKRIGGTASWSSTRAVDANGEYLFAGQIHPTFGYSIVVHEIFNPFNPTSSNGWGYHGGPITDIEANGHLIYFTTYNNNLLRSSLHICNAENPTAMGEITTNFASNKSLGLAVDGQMVYVAASTEGFYVLNATDKYAPVETDHLPLAGNVTDVIVNGGIAYIAAGDAGIFLVDVSNPADIAVMGHFDTPGSAIDLVKQGKTLFVADGDAGVIVLDVADPQNPTYVTENNVDYTYCVDLYGGILVIGTEEGVYTFNICAGLGVTNLKHYYYENAFTDLQAWDVRVNGDIAYVAGGPDGFYTLDVSNPNNPVLLDHFSVTPSVSFRRLDVDGNFAYCIDDGGFWIFDISDPADIEFRGGSGGGNLYDVFSIGEISFISFDMGFAILNTSNPYTPVVISNNLLGHTNITGIWVQGTYLYIVDNIPGAPLAASVFIYDITNFAAPFLIASNTVDAAFHDIYVDGDMAFTADTNWMILYNVSLLDPISFTTFTFGHSYGVWGFGPYCLSADFDQGVSLVNCTDPYALDPRMSIYPNATNALQITAHGDYTYVANKTSLVILRHFESAGDTYIPTMRTAQSLKVNDIPGLITEAVLDVNQFQPQGIAFDYFLSANGGENWEHVTPGVAHVFDNSGYDLRWRVVFDGQKDRSLHIHSLSIDYEINYAPTIPALTALEVEKFTGIFKLEWSPSNDTDDNVDHYILEMSDSNSFNTILKDWNVTKTSKSMFGLGKGMFFFRVRAVDNYDVVSDWSNVESTTVKMSTLILGAIVGGGLLVIIILIVVISLVFRQRKKKTPTR